MTIETECDQCGKKYRLADTAAGKKVKCKDCEHIFTIPSSQDEPEEYDDQPSQEEEDDPFAELARAESRSRRRSRQEEEEEDLPARPSKKKKKKKAVTTGGGPAINHFNVLMAIGGVVMIFLGIQEARLAGAAKSDPKRMTCAELATNGPGDNAHIILTDYQLMPNFVYEEKRPGGSWTVIFIPAVPRAPNVGGPMGMFNPFAGPQIPGMGQDFKVIIKSHKVNNQAEIGTLEQASLQGLIINKISSLGSDEKKLLRESYPNVNVDSCWIFQHDRKPASSAFYMTMLAGGVILIIGGVAWMFLASQSN